MFTVPITTAQVAVLDDGVDASEYMTRAQQAGVHWKRGRLYVPRTEEALTAIAGYIGLKAEVGSDNLRDDDDPMWNGFWMAAVDLRRRFVATTGVSTDPFRTDATVAAVLAAEVVR